MHSLHHAHFSCPACMYRLHVPQVLVAAFSAFALRVGRRDGGERDAGGWFSELEVALQQVVGSWGVGCVCVCSVVGGLGVCVCSV